jgi:hypothetical protein
VIDFDIHLEENLDVRRICRYLPLFFLLMTGVQFARAQSGFDVNMGFGTFRAKSAGLVDVNTLFPCTSPSSTCAQTPDLGNVFMGLGANLMLWKRFGIGGDVEFQPAKQDYLVLQQQAFGQQGYTIQTRTTFYDFNGIFQPISSKRATLQITGGIGGANVKFYSAVSSSGSVLGNAGNYTQFFGSSNHFQMHAGIGVQLYATEHIFIRPEIDFRYVTSFSQYGRDSVPGAMVWVGYSFGDRP